MMDRFLHNLANCVTESPSLSFQAYLMYSAKVNIGSARILQRTSLKLHYLVYTAERIAYRNLVNNLWPPQSATYHNPCREWIGAQIRADIWGYVSPGWPEKAAEFAFRDAAISHVKNGIYGEMFVAAILATAFVASDVEEVIRIGLSEIPRNCRLAEAVQDTVDWSKELISWEQVWNKINEKYEHYHPVHTINNAALVVMGLMFGQRDYETSIVVAVRGGWDTDCTGATAGSVCGMMLGVLTHYPKNG